MAARFAVYYAPPHGTPLHRFGQRWLGRDGAGDDGADRLVPHGLDESLVRSVTETPRRYDFHATLKAPFHLAPGTDADGLAAALAAFVKTRTPVTAPRLRLTALDRFVALVPDGPCPALDALAADCVTGFDRFRAPPSEEELVRRRASGLTPQQETLLARWGYPYVLDQFRFHFSLTGHLPEDHAAAVIEALDPVVAPLCRQPLAIDGVSLFVQDAPSAPFRLVRRFPFP